MTNRGTTSVHCSLAGNSLIRYSSSGLTGAGSPRLRRLYPNAVTGVPVAAYLLSRSVRGSKMYSPPVTTRLSPPGSSLFSLLKVTLSLHSLLIFNLML